ncbi:hypothetical protein F5Y16DRAFT_399147 [Xylariaceae sp. FL0255]|nr:hypothetical protein F5Y16DRAFT_399147 [Xylariaceae sp. FL0255]
MNAAQGGPQRVRTYVELRSGDPNLSKDIALEISLSLTVDAGNMTVIKSLVSITVDLETPRLAREFCPIMVAAEKADTEIFDFLVDVGADVTPVVDYHYEHPSPQDSVLSPDMVQHLIRRGVLQQDFDHESFIRVLKCQPINIDTVNIMLQKGFTNISTKSMQRSVSKIKIH